jgi:hypothetical protein
MHVKSNNIQVREVVSQKTVEFDLIPLDSRTYQLEFVTELKPFELRTFIINE